MISRDKVEEVLNKHVRPALAMDGGNVEVVEIDDSEGIVKMQFQGACHGCPMSQMTLQMTVERSLKEHIPEIKKVEAV